MKLPGNAVIARAKVANYLLKWQPENGDKYRISGAHWSERAAVAGDKCMDNGVGEQSDEVHHALPGEGRLIWHTNFMARWH
jgi:hypothetical protein